MSTLTVPFTFSDLPLPTGAATDASIIAGNTLLADIETKISGTLKVDGSAITQPISGSVTVTNFPSEPTSLAINNFPATQVISGTVAVSNQPTSIEISNLPATQVVSGTVAISNFPTEPTTVAINNFPATQPVSGTFFQATQPVSAVSLPLPTGAATETTLSALNTKVTTTLNGVKVDGSGVTQPISGTVVVSNQPTSIQVSNFPSSQTVTGSVSVSNFPASQAVTGTFWPATQPVSGTVAVSNQPTSIQVSNFPSTQAVTGTFWQATQPISGSL
jgi:hypothetical protein